MIAILCFLTNDRINMSRHTPDILGGDLFKSLADIFEIVCQNPVLS
jgi:predicted deacylase